MEIHPRSHRYIYIYTRGFIICDVIFLCATAVRKREREKVWKLIVVSERYKNKNIQLKFILIGSDDDKNEKKSTQCLRRSV